MLDAQVSVRCSPAEATPQTRCPQQRTTDVSSCLRILLVEDDDADAMIFEQICVRQKLQHKLTRAEDGQKALDMLDRGVPTDVVVLDLTMPIMNGHQFLEAIRAHPSLSRQVVYAYSSSSNPVDVTAAYDRNVAGYAPKENAEALIRVLHEFAGRQLLLPN